MEREREITTDPTVIKRIPREYHEQLYVNKFSPSGEIDKLLERKYQSTFKKKQITKTRATLKENHRPISFQ